MFSRNFRFRFLSVIWAGQFFLMCSITWANQDAGKRCAPLFTPPLLALADQPGKIDGPMTTPGPSSLNQISKVTLAYFQKIFSRLQDGYSTKLLVDEELDACQDTLDLNLAWEKELNLAKMLGQTEFKSFFPSIDQAMMDKLIAHHAYFYQAYLAALQKALNQITPGAWHLKQIEIPFHPEHKLDALVYTIRQNYPGPSFAPQTIAQTSPNMLFGLLMLRQLEGWILQQALPPHENPRELNIVIQDFNLPFIQQAQSFTLTTAQESLRGSTRLNNIYLPPTFFVTPQRFQGVMLHEFIHYLWQAKMNILCLHGKDAPNAQSSGSQFSLSEIPAYLIAVRVVQQQIAWMKKYAATSQAAYIAVLEHYLADLQQNLHGHLHAALVILPATYDDMNRFWAVFSTQGDTASKRNLLAHSLTCDFFPGTLTAEEQKFYQATTNESYQIGWAFQASYKTGETSTGEIYTHLFKDASFQQRYQQIAANYPADPALALHETILRQLHAKMHEDLVFLQEIQTYLQQNPQGDADFPSAGQNSPSWKTMQEVANLMLFPDNLSAALSAQIKTRPSN
ncbi:MAG: hypothetical protein J6Y94_05245 [Bacteriovoracaceae bacterium]|nr:hypothetical protein [Bacteriovoracaceae bacterium]